MTARYGILGTLLVEGPSGPIGVGGPKQRAVLALLLIHANRPITPEHMIDQLWGERVPHSAFPTLQAYISNLRRALEPHRQARSNHSVIAKTGGGYQLAVEPSTMDAMRFEVMLSNASAVIETDPAAGSQLLDEALELWRGPALADFLYDDFARAEIARLEELRITAIELRFTAELGLGRDAELIADIYKAVVDYPLRERLWEHLMVALYRAGRQAEALRAFGRCQAALAEELGISPSERLRQLELAILNQDPTLLWKAGAESPAFDPQPRLVGRSEERYRFLQALDAARNGNGTVLIFEGEAGIGKTRLLETLDAAAVAHGFRSAFARCVEVGGTAPLLAMDSTGSTTGHR